ncbi:MAG: polysaccharide deacetylase family protein, partial [Planctomycetota bacterium]
MKRRLRGFLDRAVGALGVRALMERSLSDSLTVLMYHRVLPDEECVGLPLESLAMPLSAFACQVMDLKTYYDTGPLGEQWSALQAGEKAERPRVAITFDDGYLDNAQYAAPLLEGAGLRATFFAATDFVGRSKTMWYDEVCLLLESVGHERAAESFGVGAPRNDEGIPGWMRAFK